MGKKTRYAWTTLLFLCAAAGAGSLAASLTPVQTYAVGSAGSQNAKWFPDGKRALIAAENTLALTDDAGKVLQLLSGPVRAIEELAIRPDGMQVAAVASGELFVWQLPGGRLIQRLLVSGTEVELVSFRTDGRLLLRLVGAKKLQLLEVGQTRLQETTLPSGYFMMSPDGKALLHQDSSTDAMTLFDAATLRPLSQSRVIRNAGYMAISADSRLFVASSDTDAGGVLTVFSAGQPARVIRADLQSVSMTFISPNEVLTTAQGEGSEGNAQTVNVRTGKAQASVPIGKAIVGLEGNQSGRLIFTGGGPPRLTQWAGASWNPPKTLLFPAGQVSAVVFGGSQSQPQPLALVGGKILRLGQKGGPLLGQSGKDLTERLTAGGFPGEMTIPRGTDENTRKVLAHLTIPEGSGSTALDISAGKVALGINLGTEGTGEIWLYPRGSIKSTLKIKAAGTVLVLAYSPDGKWLAASTNSRDTGVQVFDVGSGREVARSLPLNQSGGLTKGGLAWTADGSRLLVGRGVVGKGSSVTLLHFKP
jgi:WD40 repeat protein